MLREKPLRGAEDAPAHVLIDTKSQLPLFRYLLEALETDDVWPFSRVERMGTIAAIRHRVLSGAGVAVLPRYFVQQDLDEGRMRLLMSWLQLREDSFRLLWRAGHLHGAELKQLARELRAIELR
jgi:LysR family transcriptional regulator, glycine cleavage system transcriptional activator